MEHLKASFPTGQIVATQSALEKIPANEMDIALARHMSCDWGDLPPNDIQVNSDALIEGLRLLSEYHTADKRKFWIITEADRSVTTILLPSDY